MRVGTAAGRTFILQIPKRILPAPFPVRHHFPLPAPQPPTVANIFSFKNRAFLVPTFSAASVLTLFESRKGEPCLSESCAATLFSRSFSLSLKNKESKKKKTTKKTSVLVLCVACCLCWLSQRRLRSCLCQCFSSAVVPIIIGMTTTRNFCVRHIHPSSAHTKAFVSPPPPRPPMRVVETTLVRISPTLSSEKEGQCNRDPPPCKRCAQKKRKKPSADACCAPPPSQRPIALLKKKKKRNPEQQ